MSRTLKTIDVIMNFCLESVYRNRAYRNLASDLNHIKIILRFLNYVFFFFLLLSCYNKIYFTLGFYTRILSWFSWKIQIKKNQ